MVGRTDTQVRTVRYAVLGSTLFTFVVIGLVVIVGLLSSGVARGTSEEVGIYAATPTMVPVVSVPSAAPIPTATLVPSATPIPTVTLVPSATTVPTVTLVPSATTVPTVNAFPSATTVPTANTFPSATSVPTVAPTWTGIATVTSTSSGSPHVELGAAAVARGRHRPFWCIQPR